MTPAYCTPRTVAYAGLCPAVAEVYRHPPNLRGRTVTVRVKAEPRRAPYPRGHVLPLEVPFPSFLDMEYKLCLVMN